MVGTGETRRPAKTPIGGGDQFRAARREVTASRVGADSATVEGAEVGKMTAEPSVRHVLPSRVGLRFRSVPSASHARCRDTVTPLIPSP